ncbi:MAG: hypothetical protein ACE14S_05305 [Candidatus Bathyarchaeia archaeon]
MKSPTELPFSAGAISLFVIVFVLWTKLLLPYSYFASVLVFGLAVAYLILMGNRRQSFVLMLVGFVVLTNVYAISTHYQIITFGDAYKSYGLAKTFESANSLIRVPITSVSHPYTEDLAWYSGWPFMETLAVTVSRLSGIELALVYVFLPILFSACLFLFIYLIVNRLGSSLGLGSSAKGMAMMTFIVSPEIIYYNSTLVHNTIGLLFFLMVVYFLTVLLIREEHLFGVPRVKMLFLSLIVGTALIMTHHFSSFIMVSYLLGLGILLFLFKPWVAEQIDAARKTNLAFLGVILSAILLTWWATYASVIWLYVEAGLSRFYQAILGLGQANLFVPSSNWPLSLTPALGVNLLLLRDALMFVPAAIGFVILLKKHRFSSSGLVLILSMICFSILFTFDIFFFHQDPYRIIMMGLPFIVLCAGILFQKLHDKSHILFKLAVISITVVIISASFVGLWGHRYLPVHLYDPNVNFEKVGEHSLQYQRMIGGYPNNPVALKAIKAQAK